MLTLLVATTLLSQEPALTPADSEAVTYQKADSELGVALNQEQTAFLDVAGKRVWLKTHVVQTNAPLEMFLCKRGTKEHESVLAVDSAAFVIHGALVALGLEPGQTAGYVESDDPDEPPTFRPPSGPKVALTVHWTQDGTSHSRPATEWVRTVTRRWFTAPLVEADAASAALPEDLEIRYDPRNEELLFFETMDDATRDRLLTLGGSPAFNDAVRELHTTSQPEGMKADWVFAGSRFVTYPDETERQYLAESGTLVCVANFGEAMIDVAAVSSATNEFLLYEPWAERMPPLGWPVLLEIGLPAASEATSEASDAP